MSLYIYITYNIIKVASSLFVLCQMKKCLGLLAKSDESLLCSNELSMEPEEGRKLLP